jgi:hypothetical protein
MSAQIRAIGSSMSSVDHPEDSWNARLQPVTSIPANRAPQAMDLVNDLRFEKSIYSPPTQVSKGLTTSQAGGSFTLYDITGGTKIFDYNPATGVVTISGSLIATSSSTGTYTNITLAGTNVVTGTQQNGIYGTALYQGGTVANATVGTPNLQNGTVGTAAIIGGTITNGFLTGGTVDDKLWVTTGSNKSAGKGTLVSGSITISTNVVTTNSLIFLTDYSPGLANNGFLAVGAISNGASFKVQSSNALDVGTFAWLLVN